MQLFVLFVGYFARCIQHYIAARIVFGEGNKITDAFPATKDGTEAVEAKCQPTMRWRTLLKRTG